tara:strand:+ start:405 stop:563 length:159 start_codon:yes stop_codon:yes gene_type:complete
MIAEQAGKLDFSLAGCLTKEKTEKRKYSQGNDPSQRTYIGQTQKTVPDYQRY